MVCLEAWDQASIYIANKQGGKEEGGRITEENRDCKNIQNREPIEKVFP